MLTALGLSDSGLVPAEKKEEQKKFWDEETIEINRSQSHFRTQARMAPRIVASAEEVRRRNVRNAWFPTFNKLIANPR